MSAAVNTVISGGRRESFNEDMDNLTRQSSILGAAKGEDPLST